MTHFFYLSYQSGRLQRWNNSQLLSGLCWWESCFMGQFMTAYVHIIQGHNILAVAILIVKGNQKNNCENCKKDDHFWQTYAAWPVSQNVSDATLARLVTLLGLAVVDLVQVLCLVSLPTTDVLKSKLPLTATCNMRCFLVIQSKLPKLLWPYSEVKLLKVNCHVERAL